MSVLKQGWCLAPLLHRPQYKTRLPQAALPSPSPSAEAWGALALGSQLDLSAALGRPAAWRAASWPL